MQQVGRQGGGASGRTRTGSRPQGRAALLVDTMDNSNLPVPVKRAVERTFVRAQRSWVLHRLLIVRIGVALGLALFLTVAFQARGGIAQLAQTTGDILAGRFAQAGFGIEEIAITGQSMARESEIARALGINSNTNIFNFDAEAARARIVEIPAVADASVRKIYPSRLVVEIEEVVPVARWRVDGVTFVIDGAGVQISDAGPADDNLPLVIGDGAADDALVMIRALERFPALSDGLIALSRIADRRWDMIYETGLRVQLPESGLGKALMQLDRAQQQDRLLERDLVLIDMRVAGMLALRPAKDEDSDG